MKNYINGLAFLVIIAISACNVSRDLETPKPPLPVNFRNSAAAIADTSSVADLTWSNFFADQTLKQLIDSTLVKNYDLQIAVKNIEAAELLFKQVKWNYVPQANLNVAASSSNPSDNSFNGFNLNQSGIGTKHIEDYSAGIALSWEADIWGKIRNQNKEALAAFLQTEEAKKLVQTNLVATVSQGYYNLLMLDAQLAIAQKNARLSDSTLRIIRLQFDAGHVSSLAVNQAEAQRLVAERLVPEFEQNIAIQENALRILTAELPDKVSRNASLNDLAIPDNLSSGIPAAIVGRRPDVKSRELALNIANARVGIAKASMYPALTITGSGGVNSFKASNWFNVPASLFGAVAGGVTQPLLNRKRLKTGYDVALIDREKTVLQFRQSVLGAVGEVSDALVRIEKLKVQQTIITDRVNALTQATGNANLLFQNGMATYLEVITAQGNVLQSELDLASVKRARLSAVSDLYRALGGGWK
jgi:multidrug efflux system outer membrane protein